MIVKPENMNFSDKKFSMIIYGSPGVGKTTLALSAPDPILLDFDRGISRVRAAHRKDTSVCNNYKEVCADINSPDMRNYQTVVIDTGGSFVTFLKEWAMEEKGAKTKSGEFSGLKGFGFVKSEWNRFTEDVKTRLNKNIIYVFHSNETADKDGNPVQRLVCEGSVRNTVWTPCDFGGYVQMIGDQRVICFTPEQEYFAKGCHGIQGKIAIPTLGPDDKNDFLTRLFEQAKANIQAENEAFAPVREQYDAAMAHANEIVRGVADVDSANAALAALQTLNHALTSKKEAAALLKAKTESLGLKFDRVLNSYYVSDLTAGGTAAQNG